MKTISIIFFVSLALFFTDFTSAEVYKCEVEGRVTWQDKECSDLKNQQQVIVREQNPAKGTNATTGNYLMAYKYIGGSIGAAAGGFSATVNVAGSFASEDNNYSLSVESSSGLVSFVSIGFKETSPCSQNKNYNHIDYIRLLGLDITLMNKISGGAYYADSYNDFDNRLKVTFMCPYNGGVYTASFSQKYFNQ